jgi:hypothetical protein
MGIFVEGKKVVEENYEIFKGSSNSRKNYKISSKNIF